MTSQILMLPKLSLLIEVWNQLLFCQYYSILMNDVPSFHWSLIHLVSVIIILFVYSYLCHYLTRKQYLYLFTLWLRNKGTVRSTPLIALARTADCISIDHTCGPRSALGLTVGHNILISRMIHLWHVYTMSYIFLDAFLLALVVDSVDHNIIEL